MSRNVYSMDMDWRFRREDAVTEEQRSLEHNVVYDSVKTGNQAGPAYKASLTIPLCTPQTREFEVRALLKAHPDAALPSGFGIGITLSMINL